MPTIKLWREKGWGKKGEELHSGWNPRFHYKKDKRTWQPCELVLDEDMHDNVHTISFPLASADVRVSADDCKSKEIYMSQYGGYEVLLPRA